MFTNLLFFSSGLRQLNLNNLAEDDRQGYSIIGPDAATEAEGEFISAIEDSDDHGGNGSSADDNTPAAGSVTGEESPAAAAQTLSSTRLDRQKDSIVENNCEEENGNKTGISVGESGMEFINNDDEINGNLDDTEQKCDTSLSVLLKSRDSGCYMCIGEDSSK